MVDFSKQKVAADLQIENMEPKDQGKKTQVQVATGAGATALPYVLTIKSAVSLSTASSSVNHLVNNTAQP